jgi:hypothetical protein
MHNEGKKASTNNENEPDYYTIRKKEKQNHKRFYLTPLSRATS